MSLHRRQFLHAAFAAPALAGVRTFNIADHGAVPTPGVLSTTAIQKAIDACAESGGGRVLVPPGTFLTGGLVLKDRVNLHLSEGAVLLGSPWFRDYPPRKPRSRARYEDYLLTTLLFACSADAVSVTGPGTLNGNSKAQNDFFVPGRAGRHRPCLIWFDDCTNVVVKDVTFTSSGFWTETYTRCRNVHVNGITVRDSTFRNNDGCNIIDCDNALVENCNINSLDDAICLKGYTAAGCRNVVIRNNRVRSLCNGIKAGTDSSGGFQNILIENNVVWETGISGIALELVDGGFLRNVIVRDIQMDVVGTPIFIKLGDRNRPIATEAGPVMPGPGTLEDVHISQIRAKVKLLRKFNDEERAIYNLNTHASSITGIPGRYVERVYLRDIDIEIIESVPPGTSEDVLRTVPENSTRYPENRMFGTLPAHAFYLRHARDIHLSGIRTSIRRQDPRPAFVLDDVQESSFLDVRSTGPLPFTPYLIRKNCSGVNFTPTP